MTTHSAVHAMANLLPGLQVNTARMRANIDAVRASLPPEAASAWFDPALADHAAQLTHAQVDIQQSLLAALPLKGPP